MSMYPTDKEIEVFGEMIKFPNLDENGKFTNGDFNNTEKKASFIPAETINLILDNLNELIKHADFESNNISEKQVLEEIKKIHNEIPIGQGIWIHYTGENSEIVYLKTPLPLYGTWEKISIGGFLRFKDANGDGLNNHGAFYSAANGRDGCAGNGNTPVRQHTFLSLNASRVVPTSNKENRVANYGTWEYLIRIA